MNTFGGRGTRRLRSGLLVGAVVVMASGTAALAQATQEPKHPTLWAGTEWKSFGSREKQAYLNGFLAGVAAAQAMGANGASSLLKDSGAKLGGTVAELRSAKRLWFPYSPSVYTVQVDDYYWWTDHLGTPIIDVMLSVNRQMLNP
jgi:hypothetical protein